MITNCSMITDNNIPYKMLLKPSAPSQLLPESIKYHLIHSSAAPTFS